MGSVTVADHSSSVTVAYTVTPASHKKGHTVSHFGTQITRWVRVFAVTFAAQPAIAAFLGGSQSLTRAAAVGAAVAAVEVTVRAVWPAAPLGAINGVLGGSAAALLNVPAPKPPTITPAP